MTPARTPAATGPESRAYVFDRDLTAPTLARRRVREDLTGWKVSPDHIDIAVQVISEIATNAVEHTESVRIRLEVQRHPDEIEVAVRDSGPRPRAGLTARNGSGNGLAEGGRGLYLVQELAARWGAEPTPGNGLRVWAAIPSGGQE
ncbi:ATP-binding protein [Streptomyces sp. NPDC094438]|uniref:ATP-binding protein n=1 Tax=Streptomyces sp. NPDC094438 TaxID=3366061 RepID=UPI00380EC096